MRKRSIALATILTALLAASLAPTGSAAAATTITVGDDFFAPSSKTVAAGTKVRFKWIGGGDRHNVKKTQGPGGAFKSQTTSAAGVNFARTFSQVGTYRMICTIHPEEMRLKLTVSR